MVGGAGKVEGMHKSDQRFDASTASQPAHMAACYRRGHDCVFRGNPKFQNRCPDTELRHCDPKILDSGNFRNNRCHRSAFWNPASGLPLQFGYNRVFLEILASDPSRELVSRQFSSFFSRWRNFRTSSSSVVFFRKIPLCVLRDISDPIEQCCHHLSHKHHLEAAC